MSYTIEQSFIQTLRDEFQPFILAPEVIHGDFVPGEGFVNFLRFRLRPMVDIIERGYTAYLITSSPNDSVEPIIWTDTKERFRILLNHLVRVNFRVQGGRLIIYSGGCSSFQG